MRTTMPALPGFQTAAAWPVWSGSTTEPVTWQRMPKKAAIRLYNRAKGWDRRTHQPGKRGGIVGPSALAVLEALIFDFWHFATGRLDPGYKAIARKSGVCERTVGDALARLRQLGILSWLNRCERGTGPDGRFRLEQQTNAYTVHPEGAWTGYSAPPEPPAPAAGTWGNPPRMPSVLAAAAAEPDLKGKVQRLLEAGDRRGLEAALAQLGGAMMSRDSWFFWTATGAENPLHAPF